MILIRHASQKDLSTPLVKVHCILCSSHTIPLQCLLSLPAALPGTSLTWEVCRRVGVFDLVDIGFKFVHFQLKQGETERRMCSCMCQLGRASHLGSHV